MLKNISKKCYIYRPPLKNIIIKDKIFYIKASMAKY